MDIRSGILSTAGALGVNPLDLATAISYETAGTFDPMKTGPTTQWGQHRGLIQFGEPQAKKYGVSWDDPVASQLGPQGAVANYLRDTGVKPGMGLLDIYSAINAGGVGRYNRSDANNGGAPGTVRDKVEKQMAGHRKKAQALLGGAGDDTLAGGLSITPSSPPDTLQGAQMQPEQQQRQHMFLKNMDPATRDRLIMAMQGMTMNPNQGLMGMAQQNMQDRAQAGREAKAEAKGAEQRNRTAEWLMTQPGGEQYAQAIASGALPAAAALQMWQKASAGPDQTAVQQNYAAAVQGGYQGSFMDYQLELKKSGAANQSVTMNNGNPLPGLSKLGEGFTYLYNPDGTVQLDQQGRPIAAPIPGGPVSLEQEQETNAAQEASQKRAETQRRESDVVLSTIGNIKETIGSGGTFDLPETGIVGSRLANMGINQEAVNVKNQLGTLQGMIGFDRLQRMREESPTGGALGAISERELSLLSAQLGTLEQSSDAATLTQTLDRIEAIYSEIMRKAEAYPNASQYGFGGAGNQQAAPQGPLSDDDLLKKYGGN